MYPRPSKGSLFLSMAWTTVIHVGTAHFGSARMTRYDRCSIFQHNYYSGPKLCFVLALFVLKLMYSSGGPFSSKRNAPYMTLWIRIRLYEIRKYFGI